MTAGQLKEIFPNASDQFIRSNADDTRQQLPTPPCSEAPAAVVERNLRPRSLAKGKAKGADTARFLIRVTSFRVRLLDEDNACEKYHVDCCRYAGLVPGDSPATTQIKTGQEKVRSKGEERTEIVIERIEGGNGNRAEKLA